MGPVGTGEKSKAGGEGDMDRGGAGGHETDLAEWAGVKTN